MATADGGDVDVVLWDFGDTLADERWCWVCPAGAPGWTDAWRAFGASELCATPSLTSSPRGWQGLVRSGE